MPATYGRHRLEFRLLILGMIWMIAAFSVYLLARQIGYAWFLPLALQQHLEPIPLQQFSEAFPTFASTVALALLTVWFMGLGKSGGAVVSVGWTAIEIAYQYGQRSEVASWIIPRLPGFVYQVWPLDHLVRYLGRGGYNSNDVFAAILGGLFAYVAVLNSIPGRRRPRRD